MLIFQCSLPIVPPGINASYKIVQHHNKSGGTYRRLGDTPQAEQFKADAMMLLSQFHFDYRLIERIKASEEKTPLAVTLDFHFATMMWRRDVDGPVKAMIDILFKYIGLNDNLITDLHLRKHASKEPKTDIKVSIAE